MLIIEEMIEISRVGPHETPLQKNNLAHLFCISDRCTIHANLQRVSRAINMSCSSKLSLYLPVKVKHLE